MNEPVKFVMYEYSDSRTNERQNFTLTKEEIANLNISLHAFLGNTSYRAENDLYEKLLSVADLNGDTQIDREEFAKLAVAIRTKFPALFAEKLREQNVSEKGGKQNEFTLADAVEILKTHEGKTFTIDDVKSQNIGGVKVTSRPVSRN